MKITKQLTGLFILLAFANCSTKTEPDNSTGDARESWELSGKDTINRIDKNGLKQGLFIESSYGKVVPVVKRTDTVIYKDGVIIKRISK